MFTKEIKRKWLVDLSKINIIEFNYEIIESGYLSQEYDTLSVYVESINNEDFSLSLKDDGKKVRNKITYIISEDEFNLSIILAGKKTIKKRRYSVPSTHNHDIIIYVDIFDDYDFVIAEFNSDNEIEVDMLDDEEWFIREITNDDDFYSKKIVYK